MQSPIQMLWVDGPLSNLEQLSIASCIANGHPVHLYTYGKVSNIVAGTIVMDARQVLSDDQRFTVDAGIGYGSLAPFSNRFRYKLLFERGGIWCDTDVVLLKPLSFAAEMECFFATEYDAPEQGSDKLTVKATNCAMQIPPGNDLMRDCYDAAMTTNTEWGATGIKVLREQLGRHKLDQYLLRPNVICPVPHWDIAKVLAGLFTLPAESHAIHFYNEILRRNFFDKNGTYDPHCIYERLKTYYLGKTNSSNSCV